MCRFIIIIFFSIDFHIALSDLQVARPLCSAVQGRQSMSAIGGEVLGATPRKPPIGRNRGRPRGVRFHTPALAPHWARNQDARYDFSLLNFIQATLDPPSLLGMTSLRYDFQLSKCYIMTFVYKLPPCSVFDNFHHARSDP